MDMPFAFDDRQTAFYGLKQGSSSANRKMTLALLVRNGALRSPAHGALGLLDRALQLSIWIACSLCFSLSCGVGYKVLSATIGVIPICLLSFILFITPQYLR